MEDHKKDALEKKIGPLLAYIGRMHSTRADRFMEHLGLFRGQAFLLMVLSKGDGLTHSNIAEILDISPAAATKVIKRMEERHFVRRQPDPKDERVSRVFLEEEGWAMIHQVQKTFEQIDEVLVSHLSPEEQSTLIKLLLKVASSLQEYETESNPLHNKPPVE